MTETDDSRVIVVGAGPVGCVAAAVLAARGVPVTLLDGAPELPLELRASTFHPATLDLLTDLDGLAGTDVVPSLIDQGLIADRFAYRDRRTGPVASFDLSVIADVTGHPYRLQCEQFRLCQELLLRFMEQPLVTVRFGAHVEAAVDRGDHAVVTLADGSEHAAAAVIAADGASSAVRKSLRLGFDGMTYEDRYLVLSTTHEFADDLDDLALVNYISDPDEWLVLLRTVALWRALFPVGVDETDDEALSQASAQRRLRGVVDRADDYEVHHRTIYRVHQRVAERFRVGRVLLAGDAAHINNPLGGMGMNGGVHDAILLGHGLAGYLAGAVTEERLDAMADCRRRLALEYVQRHTHENAVSLAAPDGAAREAAMTLMAERASSPESARDYVLQASMMKARWEMDELLAEATAGASS